MTKWFIKKTCIATNDNPSFPNAVQTYILGKKQNILMNKVDKDVNGYRNWITEEDNRNNSRFIEEFGYSSKKMAEFVVVESLKQFDEKDRFWNFNYEIISFDI